MSQQPLKALSLKERAACFAELVRMPGWQLLRQSFRPEIRCRITDTDAREAFLYEAVRAQVLQEIFGVPYSVMRQAERLGYSGESAYEPDFFETV
jgi:hypothetical protein